MPPLSHAGRLPLALLLFLLALGASAQSSRETGYDLLRLEPSARAAALAGTVASVSSDDPAAVFYNPALLVPAMHRGLSVGYLNHLGDVNAGFVSYARTLDAWGTFSAGVRFLSYGEFERAEDDGTADGSTYGAGEAALSVSYAADLAPNLRGGVTAHTLFAWLDDADGQALAADLGIHYHLPDQRLGLSASLHGLGAPLSSLGAESDRLPLDLRLGVSKGLQYIPLTLSVVGYDLHDYGGEGSALDEALRHVAVGGEFQFGEAVRVRLGYNPGRHEELSTGGRLDLAGLSAGFGLHLARVGFDYAFNSWSEIGGLHQLSVRTRL
ncbi:MAG: type IX secretion system protein PorQ [Rubricoccaceae bacterium]|nr:type IX secretion system protein PorQ [Rubricoccaceae bacterium]